MDSISLVPMSSEELQRAIAGCVAYLDANCRDTGRFRYLRYLDPEQKNPSEYNLLRHAGAIYAVCDYTLDTGDAAPLAMLRRATGYLMQYVRPLPSQPELSLLWSTASRGSNSQPVAKLGGAGLSLAALSLVEQLIPGTVPLASLQGLARFIGFLQQPDGSFYSRYFPDSDYKDPDWRSLYYPGEAAIGLALLFRLDPDQRWLDLALATLRYLATLRQGQSQVEADHWALLATLELYRLHDRTDTEVDWELLLRHGVQIAENIIGSGHLAGNAGRYPLHFDWLEKNRRSTPLSTRLEGILALFETLDSREANFRSALFQFASQGVRQLFDSQIQEAPFRGGIAEFLSAPSVAHEQVEERPSEVRIDYVQHGLSAMLRYRRILSSSYLDKYDLVLSLRLGMEYLCRSQNPMGNFVYGYDWLSDREDGSDGPVRQAGAAWGLALLFGYTGSVDCLSGALRAVEFFAAHSDRHSAGGRYIRYPNTDKGLTGTVALVALTLVELLREESGLLDSLKRQTLLAQLQEYISFLLLARHPDGRFHGNFRNNDGVPFGAPSPYFDGESLLCLVKAWKYFGFSELLPVVLEAARVGHQRNIDEAVRQHPDSDVTKGYYQWSSMAFYELATAEQLDRKQRNEYGDYLLHLAHWMIETHQVLKRPKNTAYAYEGLLHALHWGELTGRTESARLIRRTVEEGITRLISWQVGHPRACPYISQRQPPIRALGGVQNARNESFLRIDVTQHQMHALMLTLKFYFDAQHLSLS